MSTQYFLEIVLYRVKKNDYWKKRGVNGGHFSGSVATLFHERTNIVWLWFINESMCICCVRQFDESQLFVAHANPRISTYARILKWIYAWLINEAPGPNHRGSAYLYTNTLHFETQRMGTQSRNTYTHKRMIALSSVNYLVLHTVTLTNKLCCVGDLYRGMLNLSWLA
jgi:hypothetical protein